MIELIAIASFFIMVSYLSFNAGRGWENGSAFAKGYERGYQDGYNDALYQGENKVFEWDFMENRLN